MNSQTRLWIGLAVLVLLTPLGLFLPALLGAGGAWGEWGREELEKMLGYLPEGMKHAIDRWNAPLPDYSTGKGEGMGRLSLEYILSALLGVALCAGVVILLMKFLKKGDGNDS